MNFKVGTVLLLIFGYVNAGQKIPRDASEIGYLYEKPNMNFEIPESKVIDDILNEENSGFSIKEDIIVVKDLENKNHDHHNAPKLNALEIAKEIIEEKEEEIREQEKHGKRESQTGQRGTKEDRNLKKRLALPLLGKAKTKDETLEQKPVTETKQTSRV